MTGVSGLGKLIDDYDGEPRTLRWLSVHPDGRVVDRESDNRIAWSTVHEMWVQWRLVRDVYRVVDPTSHGYRLTAAELVHTGQGVAILARCDTEPINPTATRMLTALGIDHKARGTVAWLAQAHSVTGLHGDLDDEQRTGLRALAEGPGGETGHA